MATKFVYDLYKKKNDITCPRCRGGKHYVINTGYLRCPECVTDHNPFTDTWIGWIGISTTRWLVLIHLFGLEISSQAAARESGISYRVVLDTFNLMRYIITRHMAGTDPLLRPDRVRRGLFRRKTQGKSGPRGQKQGGRVWHP